MRESEAAIRNWDGKNDELRSRIKIGFTGEIGGPERPMGTTERCGLLWINQHPLSRSAIFGMAEVGIPGEGEGSRLRGAMREIERNLSGTSWRSAIQFKGPAEDRRRKKRGFASVTVGW